MKTCTKCKILQPKTGFHKHCCAKDGLQHVCKTCRKLRNKSNKGEKVSADQKKEIIDSLNSTQLKVYEVIPALMNFEYNQITTAFQRKYKITLPRTQFADLLAELVLTGLVTEKPKGYFTRSKVVLGSWSSSQDEIKPVSKVEPVEVKPIMPGLEELSAVSNEIEAMIIRLGQLKSAVNYAQVSVGEKLTENKKALAKAEKIAALFNAINE